MCYHAVYGFISIRIAQPTEDKPSASQVDPPSQQEASELSTSEAAPADDTGKSDFKAAMDSYETFIDEHCAFMKRYNESSDPASMVADYSSMMARYAELSAKIDDIADDDLTPDELAYYTEVMTRTNQKMAELL